MTQQYTPTLKEVREGYQSYIISGKSAEEKRAEFDRWLAEERAKVWLEALQHVQRLSDPAYTVSLTPDREILTLPDVYQAMAENPYTNGAYVPVDELREYS